MPAQKLIEAFKELCAIEYAEYETQAQADFIGDECEAARVAILRILDDLDPQGYVDCTAHWVGLVQFDPPNARNTEAAQRS
jgi:hypothetical protein